MAESGFTHDNVNNKTVEWYTPSWIFEELGVFWDLDPCQPVGGVPWIPTLGYHTVEDNGLAQDWYGKVWLNPPYGKETPVWLAKMHQHRNGIALLFARTDCAWFHNYCAKADAIMFLKGRVRFVDGKGVTKGSGAGSGSMLVAWGAECVEALKNLNSKGVLWDLRSEMTT